MRSHFTPMYANLYLSTGERQCRKMQSTLKVVRVTSGDRIGTKSYRYFRTDKKVTDRNIKEKELKLLAEREIDDTSNHTPAHALGLLILRSEFGVSRVWIADETVAVCFESVGKAKSQAKHVSTLIEGFEP
jgi:hypothetical protein